MGEHRRMAPRERRGDPRALSRDSWAIWPMPESARIGQNRDMERHETTRETWNDMKQSNECSARIRRNDRSRNRRTRVRTTRALAMSSKCSRDRSRPRVAAGRRGSLAGRSRVAAGSLAPRVARGSLAGRRGIARAAGRSRVAAGSLAGRRGIARAAGRRGSPRVAAGSLAGPSARPATTRKARQLSRALAIASSPPQSNMCSIRTGVRPAGPERVFDPQPDTPPPPFTFGQRYYSYAFGGGFHLLLCPLPPPGLPTPTSSNTRPLGVSQPNSGAPR